jgi:hypothetical protein
VFAKGTLSKEHRKRMASSTAGSASSSVAVQLARKFLGLRARLGGEDSDGETPTRG